MKFIVHTNMPFERLPFKVLFGVMLFASGLLWVFLLSSENEIFSKVKVVELVVAILILLGSLITIFIIGYQETYLDNLTITYCIHIVLSILILYLTKTGLSLRPETGIFRTLFYCLQFIIYTFLSVIVTFLPSAIICLLMYGIMNLFGNKS